MQNAAKPEQTQILTEEQRGEIKRAKVARKRIANLERRANFLEARVEQDFGGDQAKGARDREEAASLRWAIARLKQLEAFEPAISKVLDLAAQNALNLYEVAGLEAIGNR